MKIRLLTFVALSCLLVSSCKNNDSIINEEGNVPASFSASINAMTRVVGTSWESGDSIGIFMLQNGEVINEVSNYCYSTVSGDGVFTATNADSTIYYPINKSKVDFIVYNPYRKYISNTYIVSNWNSTRQDTLDLLVAKATDHSQSNPDVSLSFYHQFSKIVLELSANNETGLTNADLAGLSVAINGINKPASYSLLTKEVTYSASLNEAVIMKVSQDGLTAEAIVPSTSGTDVVITLKDSSTYTWDISNYTFEPGKLYPFSIALKAAPNYVEAKLGSVINDWNSADSVYIDLDQDTLFSASGIYNGHDYVDLGITDDNGNPIYWATCNVGSNSPEEYGDYFAWGETKAYGEEDTSNISNYTYTSGSYTKTYYEWNTYKYSNGGTSADNPNLTKYCQQSNYGSGGFTDAKTVLDPTDDAATQNWGGAWRMPTFAELTILCTECYWEWTDSYNGQKGYVVYKVKSDSDKGKYSYNSPTLSCSYDVSDTHIFLPATGYRYSDYLVIAGSYGDYWSSSLGISYSNDACGVSLCTSGVYGTSFHRRNGQTVRPVCSPSDN